MGLTAEVDWGQALLVVVMACGIESGLGFSLVHQDTPVKQKTRFHRAGTTGDRSPMSEVRCQRSGVRSQESGDRGQRAESGAGSALRAGV